jgi:uncharacterized membrane protein YphA (DoxX/SURF4 family)
MLIGTMLKPLIVFGHEVYVLTPNQVTRGLRGHVNIWQALQSSHNLRLFVLCGLLVLAVLGACTYLKSLRFFQGVGGFIDRATPIAPDIIRIAFGASLLFSLKNQALFGPELPLSGFPLANLLRPLLFLAGIALILGVGIRIFGIIAAAIWVFAFADKGWYMLTYLNYLGEALAVILLSRQLLSVDTLMSRAKKTKQKRGGYERYSMPIARVFFALSLLYAAISVKFIHTALSLDVVNGYHLTRYFPFDPLFVVLGAGLIEILVATLYLVGFLQRFNTLVFLVFMSLSILFFKESVWPHYLLIGLGVGIFLHEPDDFALDKYWPTKRRGTSPKPKPRHP